MPVIFCNFLLSFTGEAALILRTVRAEATKYLVGQKMEKITNWPGGQIIDPSLGNTFLIRPSSSLSLRPTPERFFELTRCPSRALNLDTF